MLRHTIFILLAITSPPALHAQDAAGPKFNALKIHVMADESGGFQLLKTKMGGTGANLLVDSGAQVEVAATKSWSIAQGKELKEAGHMDGIAGLKKPFGPFSAPMMEDAPSKVTALGNKTAAGKKRAGKLNIRR